MDDVVHAFFRAAFDRAAPTPIVQGFVAAFIAEWSRGIRYYAGIHRFLSELAKDYRLSILSNTHYPALIHDHLARMEITPYFTHIVTSVECGWRKPHPCIFQQALANLAITANDALYIGDTYIDDYEGSQAAGIRAILIDPYDQHPDVVDRISSLFALKNMLGAEGRELGQ